MVVGRRSLLLGDITSRRAEDAAPGAPSTLTSWNVPPFRPHCLPPLGAAAAMIGSSGHTPCGPMTDPVEARHIALSRAIIRTQVQRSADFCPPCARGRRRLKAYYVMRNNGHTFGHMSSRGNENIASLIAHALKEPLISGV